MDVKKYLKALREGRLKQSAMASSPTKRRKNVWGEGHRIGREWVCLPGGRRIQLQPERQERDRAARLPVVPAECRFRRTRRLAGGSREVCSWECRREFLMRGGMCPNDFLRREKRRGWILREGRQRRVFWCRKHPRLRGCFAGERP